MKFLGQRKLRFPNKVDHRIREGHRKMGNWWEDCNSETNKALEKRRWQHQVQDEVSEQIDEQMWEDLW